MVVYDVRGTLVDTLVNECKGPGSYEVTWKADSVAAGIYFYKLMLGDSTSTKKVVLDCPHVVVPSIEANHARVLECNKLLLRVTAYQHRGQA